jgi:hypothetical protein
MNNSIPHLVARALRGRRTITWSYARGLTLSNPFHGLTRSQILKDVRKTHLEEPKYFNFGLEYEPSLDRSKLPNPEEYGIWAYAYPAPPPPELTPPPLTPEQRNANAQRLHIDRIAAACYALDGLNPTLAGKIRSALA